MYFDLENKSITPSLSLPILFVKVEEIACSSLHSAPLVLNVFWLFLHDALNFCNRFISHSPFRRVVIYVVEYKK